MSNHDTEVLNSVTKTLIDSCKGYDTCCDVSDDSHALSTEFRRRRAERMSLVEEFKAKVRALGGEPVEEGSAAGAVHRAFLRFTSLFRDDEAAAISALDDGEEYLAEKIEDRLENTALSPDCRALLQKAHRSAKNGERFADCLVD